MDTPSSANGGARAAIVLFDHSGEGGMEMRQTLYVTSREEWRVWLTTHHQSETEVWLIFYKKHSGQPRISYDHAGRGGPLLRLDR